MHRWFIPPRLHELLIQVGIAGLVYAAGLRWAFWAGRAWGVGHLGANEEDEVTLVLLGTYQDEA